MEQPLILAIDCGTQSVRGLLFDEGGHLVAKHKVEFGPYSSPVPGYTERNVEDFWRDACTALQALKEEAPEAWSRIGAVAVTTQRDTVVAMDADGVPLRPAFLWSDQRMARCDTPMPLVDRLQFAVTGMTTAVEITRRQGKDNWMVENEPELWARTSKWLLLSGYFCFKLTGRYVDSMASQVGHIPFDYRGRGWPRSDSSWRWHMFSVRRDQVPELTEPGERMGTISSRAASETGIPEGMPIIAAGSDKGCETLGVGCVDTSSVSLSFGTAATVQTTSRKYLEPIMFMPSYPASVKGSFNPEIQIFRGYWMVSWFKKEFAAHEAVEAERRGVAPEVVLNEHLEDVPPGSQGLMIQPYWGPGLKTPEAKGSMIGFGDVHTRSHIYRAIIEGIGYALLEGVERIERKSGQKVNRVMVSGGGSQSDVICQITADLFNRPVVRSETYETSGLGAAINGFVGLGVHANHGEAVARMVHWEKTFTPRIDAAHIYRELYERVYKRIYPALEPLYHQIHRITGYPDI
ncbi:MAG: FGGY-family carbohydrate kinase [Caldisericota bacterium]|jgi:sugar (pentulose or hexulose) kinase|nr:FGGY-family carbohydrate kinase [Caldisericota bacterium]